MTSSHCCKFPVLFTDVWGADAVKRDSEGYYLEGDNLQDRLPNIPANPNYQIPEIPKSELKATPLRSDYALEEVDDLRSAMYWGGNTIYGTAEALYEIGTTLRDLIDPGLNPTKARTVAGAGVLANSLSEDGFYQTTSSIYWDYASQIQRIPEMNGRELGNTFGSDIVLAGAGKALSTLRYVDDAADVANYVNKIEDVVEGAAEGRKLRNGHLAGNSHPIIRSPIQQRRFSGF